VVSNWSRAGNTRTFYIEVPPNATATVYIPTNDVEGVLEGGQPATRANGVTYLETDGIHAVFSVDSGVYQFFSP